MRKVRYTAKAVVRDGALYVPPSARPTTAMVHALSEALDLIGGKRDMPWLGDMARVAAFGGLRFGEQTAVRPADYDPAENRLEVASAWAQPSGQQPALKLPKNGHARSVLLPGSLRAALTARAAVASQHGPDALLVRPDRRACPGRAAIPYRNLRHHAAMWMRQVAKFEWPCVSTALGHASVDFTHARYVRSRVDAEERNRKNLEGL